MRARVIREYKLEVSTLVLILGIFITLIGFQGTFFDDPAIPIIADLARDLGGWTAWLSVIGPILILGGIWIVGDGVVKRREFNRLMDTTSKATFVRNLDRIEELAWLLSEEHERRVFERKRELRVK